MNSNPIRQTTFDKIKEGYAGKLNEMTPSDFEPRFVDVLTEN